MKTDEQDLRCKSGPFWDSLGAFWTPEHVQNWKRSIFTDPCKPNAIESCNNLITIGLDVQFYWERGRFALKPIRLSDDRKELEVQLFWQPIHKHDEGVDLLMEPISAEGISQHDLTPQAELFRVNLETPGWTFVYSGDIFILRTDDPIRRPLPHLHLLEMQWILQRIVRMSEAGDWQSHECDTNSDISFTEEENAVDDDGPRVKSICNEGTRFPKASFDTFEGIYDWIPDPEMERPEATPLQNPSSDAPSLEPVPSENLSDRTLLSSDIRMIVQRVEAKARAVDFSDRTDSDRTGSDPPSLGKSTLKQLHKSPITPEDGYENPHYEQKVSQVEELLNP